MQVKSWWRSDGRREPEKSFPADRLVIREAAHAELAAFVGRWAAAEPGPPIR